MEFEAVQLFVRGERFRFVFLLLKFSSGKHCNRFQHLLLDFDCVGLERLLASRSPDAEYKLFYVLNNV